jgi:VanZ family protein
MWTFMSWARVKRLIAGYYGIGALLILTELGQIFLPERHAGLPDILYGLIGLSAGGLVGLAGLAGQASRRFKWQG